MRIMASVNIDQAASQVWVYVADYGNDTSWRGGVTQMRRSQPGPAQEGVTTHELLRLLGMTFRTDAAMTGSSPDAASSGAPTTGKAAARLSAGGADRPGQLPVHRGGGGPPARPVSSPGAGGGLAAPAAGHGGSGSTQAAAGDLDRPWVGTRGATT
jgi:hypothetical protein